MRLSISSAKAWRLMLSPGFNCCISWTLHALNFNILCSILCTVARWTRYAREARRRVLKGFVSTILEVVPQHNLSQLANHFQDDLGRYRSPRMSVASFWLSYHLEVFYWNVCGNFILSESLILFREASLQGGRIPEQPPFYSEINEDRNNAH
jgi:hypothetical protein